MLLYGLLARLEVQFAHLVQTAFPDPWGWIERLTPDSRAAVIGYWEIAKRGGVDIGPTASLMLSQLVNIVSSSDRIARAMGFRTKREIKNLLKALPDLRNHVAHPVRPLVLGESDVAALATVVSALGLVGRRAVELPGGALE
ncbi:MAG TPA: hypothetical protein VFC53_10015 [Dehalococcoidia bacterium]|nr:hypothetical protein [Dehalococcoidia bacterium]